MAAMRELRSQIVWASIMESVGAQVAVEQACLREQARRVKSSAINKLPIARRSSLNAAEDSIATLWPNLLSDSDMQLSIYVPDTEDIQDSQLPQEYSRDVATLPRRVGSNPHLDPVDECEEDDSDTDNSKEESSMPPFEELMSGDEEDNEEELPITEEAPVEVTQPTRVGRQLVDKEHVKVLVLSYQRAFAAFKRSKKGEPPSHLIPSKVWKQAYGEYKKKFPQSNFKEDSLKEHLRQSVRDLAKVQQESGNDGETTAVDEELIEKLMATDSLKARNVLQSQFDVMNYVSGLCRNAYDAVGGSVTASEASGQAGSDPTVATNPGARTKKVSMVCKPPTKSQNLKEARQDISAMLQEFKSMSEDRRADSNRKRMLADTKASLHEAKRHEAEARVATLIEQRGASTKQAKMGRLNLLKEQKALGLITEEQFTEKC